MSCRFLPRLVLLLLVLPVTTGEGCLNLPHEWSLIAASRPVESPGFYGLSDAFAVFRKKLDEQLVFSGKASGTVSVIFVSWGSDMESPAPVEHVQRVGMAFDHTWPPGSFLIPSEPILIRGDPESIASQALRSTTPFVASIHVLQNDAQQMNFFDLVFFRYSVVREVFKEETRVQVKVLDRNGEIVFLDEIAVSPTIIHDLMFAPEGGFFSYLEKHDSRPRLLDFGELYQNVATGSFQDRPEEMRLPDLSTSAPMPAPMETASGTKEPGK